MKRLVALLLLCTSALSLRAGADALTTIELHSRPAEDVIPIVQPLLGPDDAVTGQGFKLFLRAPQATVAQVRQIVASLDVAPKMLLISVFQGSDRDLRTLGVSGDLRIGDDDGSVAIGTSRHRDGGADVRLSTRNASGGANVTSTRSRLRDSPVHQLRVSEGSEGYIETGASIPYFSGTQWYGRGMVGSSVEYKDVTTGFYVLPRVRGDQVSLEVSPFKQSLNQRGGGSIDTRRARTTVNGRLGDWLPIGGTTEQVQRSHSAIGSYSTSSSRNNTSIWIKAEPVP
jgi:type II secretory pathway component GspD/PulD (secretin)